MEKLTVSKRLDDLGRIAIPKEIRDELSWKDADLIEFYKTDDGILLKKKDENEFTAGEKLILNLIRDMAWAEYKGVAKSVYGDVDILKLFEKVLRGR